MNKRIGLTQSEHVHRQKHSALAAVSAERAPHFIARRDACEPTSCGQVNTEMLSETRVGNWFTVRKSHCGALRTLSQRWSRACRITSFCWPAALWRFERQLRCRFGSFNVSVRSLMSSELLILRHRPSVCFSRSHGGYFVLTCLHLRVLRSTWLRKRSVHRVTWTKEMAIPVTHISY